jgi:hypothetical protein
VKFVVDDDDSDVLSQHKGDVKSKESVETPWAWYWELPYVQVVVFLPESLSNLKSGYAISKVDQMNRVQKRNVLPVQDSIQSEKCKWDRFNLQSKPLKSFKSWPRLNRGSSLRVKESSEGNINVEISWTVRKDYLSSASTKPSASIFNMYKKIE